MCAMFNKFMEEVVPFYRSQPTGMEGKVKYRQSKDPKNRGACFLKEVDRFSIMTLEFDEPYKNMTLFDISGIDTGPMEVPSHMYHPYPGCIFVSCCMNKKYEELIDLPYLFLN